MSKGCELDFVALGFSAAEQAFLRGLDWDFSHRVQRANGCKTVYVAHPLGIAMTTLSPRKAGACPERWFTIGSEEKRYRSLAEVLAAARERGLVAQAMHAATQES